jgi:membrane protein YdbS with pleckstrin-like domain
MSIDPNTRRPPPPRSALTLRLVLAIFGLLISCVAVVLFAVQDLPPAPIAIAAALAVVAAVDLVIVIRRKMHGEPG